MKRIILNVVGVLAFFLILFQMIESKGSESNNRESSNDKRIAARGNIQIYYRLLDEALHKMEVKDYDGARPLLEEALPYAGLQPEIAMIHHQLAKIYRERNDYENELISQRAIVKYTMNQDAKRESNARIEELTKLVDTNRKIAPLTKGTS